MTARRFPVLVPELVIQPLGPFIPRIIREDGRCGLVITKKDSDRKKNILGGIEV